MTTVIGIRHGEVLNPEGVIYAGLSGFGLSDLGRSQAEAVAEDVAPLGVGALYASPLDRAMETAAVLGRAAGVEVIPDDRLHEWRHWQQWAGLTWEELREQGAETWELYSTDPGAVTSGESLEELAGRMQSWLEEVRARHDGALVIGVTHLEPLRAILLRLHDRPATDLFQLQIGPAEAVRLHPDPLAEPALPSVLVRG